MTDTHSFTALGFGIIISILFSLFTIRRKALTLDGAVVASLLGLWVLWFAGAKWLIPLFFFFITSTIIGRWTKKHSLTSDAKHGKARDYMQVWCNGGIYAVLATFANQNEPNLIYVLMLVSMAICTADTWSSEIGIYFRWKTYDVLRWEPVPTGLSGGVSMPGTVGGLVGALAIALVGNIMLFKNFKIDIILLISLSGFLGMLLDSILGASVQARYENSLTHTLTDHKDEHHKKVNGWHWMTNDAVNFWSNLIITLLVALQLFYST